MLKQINKTIAGVEFGTTEISAYEFVCLCQKITSIDGNINHPDMIEYVLELQINRTYYKNEAGEKVYFTSLNHIKEYFEDKHAKMAIFYSWCCDNCSKYFLSSEFEELTQKSS